MRTIAVGLFAALVLVFVAMPAEAFHVGVRFVPRVNVNLGTGYAAGFRGHNANFNFNRGYGGGVNVNFNRGIYGTPVPVGVTVDDCGNQVQIFRNPVTGRTFAVRR